MVEGPAWIVSLGRTRTYSSPRVPKTTATSSAARGPARSMASPTAAGASRAGADGDSARRAEVGQVVQREDDSGQHGELPHPGRPGTGDAPDDAVSQLRPQRPDSPSVLAAPGRPPRKGHPAVKARVDAACD